MFKSLTNYTIKDKELGKFRHLESVILSLSIGTSGFLGVYLAISRLSQFILVGWLVLSLGWTILITLNVITEENKKRFSRIRDGVKLMLFISISFSIYYTLLFLKHHVLKLIFLKNIITVSLLISLILLAITQQRIENWVDKYFKRRFPILFRRWKK